MVKQNYGKIVNTISDAGRVGEPGTSVYSGAKAGVVGFTKALAKEMGRNCINVNCVAPGATYTEATFRTLGGQGSSVRGSAGEGAGRHAGLPHGQGNSAVGASFRHCKHGSLSGFGPRPVDHRTGDQCQRWILYG